MDKKQELFLQLPTSNISNVSKFPNDPNSDIEIIYKRKSFKLQKSLLIQASKYFNKNLIGSCQNIQIKGTFDEAALKNVLSVFYGNVIPIDRNQVQNYFQIAKFLQIQHLIKVILKDIHDLFQQYDTFIVLKMAFDNKLQQIQKLCLQQLQNQQFQQLKYYQLSLLNINKDLFKKIIKLHNAYKKINRKGIKSQSIFEIVKLYCQANNIQGFQAQQMKVELIDITILNSFQFKLYFLQPLFRKIQKYSSINTDEDWQNQQVKFKKYIKNFFQILKKIQNKQSTMSEQIYGALQMKYYIQNIYLQKKIKQLTKQNQKLAAQLNSMRTLSNVIQLTSKSLNNSSDQGLPKKIGLNKQKNIQQITKYITVIDKMNEQFEEKLQVMSKIVNDYQKSQKHKQSSILQSASSFEYKFLTGTDIHNLMVNDKIDKPPVPISRKNSMFKTRKLMSLTTQVTSFSLDSGWKIDKQYVNRINFDIKPTCLRPQMMKFLTQIVNSGFNKKIFTLIYRRSLKYPQVGWNYSIYDRKGGLLVLIKNKKQEVIGGLITSVIQKFKKQIEDKNAFIFNLNKRILCKIQQHLSKKAILMSPVNLLSFSTNLQIPNQQLTKKIISRWPGAYKCQKIKKQNSYLEISLNSSLHSGSLQAPHRNELEIQQQFEIQSIQVYEMQDNQMQMVL